MAKYIDNQIDILYKLLSTFDNSLKNDINTALNSFKQSNKLDKLELSSKFERLDNTMSIFKEISDLPLYFHIMRFKELEQLICAKLNKNQIATKELDNFLTKNFGLKKYKKRILNEKTS
jgi:hypothetical protein